MKNLFFLVACAFLFSCNNDKDENKSPKAEKDKKISKRDFSITSANSYSDLFLDSLELEKFIAANQLNDSLTRRLRSFYNTRNYQYAWFTSQGLTEHARGFWNLHDYQTTYNKDSFLFDKALQKTMSNLIAEDELSVNASNKNIRDTEFKLTRNFILYALHNIEDGYIKRKEMERFIPRKREDAMKVADSLITKKHKDNKYYEDVNEPYKKLKQQLKVYYDIAASGGWPEITGEPKLYKMGSASSEILALKKRLSLTGDFKVNDTTPVFNTELENAIKQVQLRHGYSPDGKLTASLIKDLNVPANERVKQILINMGRMQWMITQPSGKLIMVNIPEFHLHVMEGPNKIFDMDVVVGKEGHNTMIFTGDLNQVVFSPYWNVPASIVRKEILPAIEKNPGYLASQNMEITGNEGDLPVIRQLPGSGNSLGKVKFLFPNSFNIYFHDTPAKSLFQKDKRAYSHGCIRLAEPEKMANYLLKDDPSWNFDKIRAAMNSGTEKYVRLKNPVPVLITYYTSWVAEDGLLHFAEDIYDHDKRIATKMFL